MAAFRVSSLRVRFRFRLVFWKWERIVPSRMTGGRDLGFGAVSDIIDTCPAYGVALQGSRLDYK